MASKKRASTTPKSGRRTAARANLTTSTQFGGKGRTGKAREAVQRSNNFVNSMIRAQVRQGLRGALPGELPSKKGEPHRFGPKGKKK